jgi:ribbon-helix-helix CopG family protein
MTVTVRAGACMQDYDLALDIVRRAAATGDGLIDTDLGAFAVADLDMVFDDEWKRHEITSAAGNRDQTRPRTRALHSTHYLSRSSTSTTGTSWWRPSTARTGPCCARRHPRGKSEADPFRWPTAYVPPGSTGGPGTASISQMAELPSVASRPSSRHSPRSNGRLSSYRWFASRCYDASVPKTRTTLTIDEAVLRAVKVRAARTGKGDSEVIEEALRAHLGLDLLDRLWKRNEMGEEEAVALAVEAQHASRRGRR